MSLQNANEVISKITYSDPDTVKEYRSIQPIISLIDDTYMTINKDIIVNEFQNLLAILLSIEKNVDLITKIDSIKTFLTSNITTISNSIKRIHDDKKGGVTYQQVDPTDIESFRKMRPIMAIIMQLPSDSQYSSWLLYHTCQVYTILLFVASIMVGASNDYTIIVSNHINVLFQKYDWLKEDVSLFELVVPLNNMNNGIFRGKLKGSLSSEDLKRFCFGKDVANIADTSKFVKEVVLQKTGVSGFTRLAMGDLKPKIYIRMIQSFALAPFFDEYKEYTAKTSIVKLLDMDLNVYVKETFLNEYSSSVRSTVVRERESDRDSSRGIYETGRGRFARPLRWW